MNWPNFLDRLLPFFNEPLQRGAYHRWKHMPSQQILRELEIRRLAVSKGEEVERLTLEQEVLWRIEVRRQRRIERRADMNSLLIWLGLKRH